jgi:SAM-dependent methyltransferase
MALLTRIGYELAALGDRLNVDALRYNPAVFAMYDRLAAADAPQVVQALRATFPEARSAIDVGAGTGRFAREATRDGLPTVAIERSRLGRRRARAAGGEALPFDLGRSPPAPVTGGFDLAWCFEVAEHVPARHAERLVQFLAGLAPVVVITAARPGQGGTGHVNEQPADYWVARFSACGMTVDAASQRALVERLPLGQLSPHWRLTSILVFRADR